MQRHESNAIAVVGRVGAAHPQRDDAEYMLGDLRLGGDAARDGGETAQAGTLHCNAATNVRSF